MSLADLPAEAAGAEGFDNVADAMAMQASVWLGWAELLSEVVPASPVVTGARCDDWAGCRAVVERIAGSVRGEALSAELVADAASLFEDLTQSSYSPREALVESLRLVLFAPEVLYRSWPEAGALSAAERARRLSYLLWNVAPDAATGERLAALDWRDRASLRPVLIEMLSDQRGARFLDGFIDAWLGYGRIADPDEVPLNPRYPDMDLSLRARLRAETRAFLADWIAEDAPIQTLFTESDQYLDRALASFYGIDAALGEDITRVSVADYPSAGILDPIRHRYRYVRHAERFALAPGLLHHEETAVREPAALSRQPRPVLDSGAGGRARPVDADASRAPRPGPEL